MPSNDAAKMLHAGRQQPRRTLEAVPAAPDVGDEPGVIRAVERYVKAGFFITPDQRVWLNEVTARAKLGGLEGISASDLVRLALARLRTSAEGAEAHVLDEDLIQQAHEEAIRFPGRKNRGLPRI